MLNKLSRRLFAAGASCLVLPTFAAIPRCEVCRRRLDRKCWTYQGRKCCSPECADQLRPTCSICKKIVRGEFFKADDKTFCSEACFKKTLPKCEICATPIQQGYTITRHRYCQQCIENKPTCFSCGLPAAHPTRLEDGREICNHCIRWAVTSQEMAQQHYERARRQLEAWTSLKLETVPELVLVNRDEMRKLSKKLRKSDSPVSIRGLYSRQIRVTKHLRFGRKQRESSETTEKIYIVDHLHDEVFRVAAMHELMHDLMNEHFPALKDAPLWVHEGICQQAAAEYCRRRNYVDILHGIDHCPDPDYGDGYRYINSQTGFEGWNALRRWMENADISMLPKHAPKESSQPIRFFEDQRSHANKQQ